MVPARLVLDLFLPFSPQLSPAFELGPPPHPPLILVLLFVVASWRLSLPPLSFVSCPWLSSLSSCASASLCVCVLLRCCS
ncbi:hypothetical_protein [Leishmania major strain Friedlin]|nr:hypothetical_protein [Leishmania major strain Friedlin]